MVGPSIPKVMIVVVVTRDRDEDLASSATAVGGTAENRTRHEHAQANSGQPDDIYPSGSRVMTQNDPPDNEGWVPPSTNFAIWRQDCGPEVMKILFRYFM